MMLRLFLFPHPSSSSTCWSTRMCWEVVVVIVVLIVVVVVVAGAQNKKKKGQKKRVESGHVRSRHACELSCRCHHRRYIYNKSILFFLFLFRTNFIFIHVCAQLLTLVIYATFNWCLVILPHLSFISSEYAQTRVMKATIHYVSAI